MNERIDSFISVAKTHIKRLEFAMVNLASIMPVDSTVITNMSDLQFMYFEVMTGRFAKLQDFVGK